MPMRQTSRVLVLALGFPWLGSGAISPAHAELASAQSVHSFEAPNGVNPRGPLLLAPDGNFYGTVQSGGPGGRGTVVRLTPSGALSTIASFSGEGSGGQYPGAPLVSGVDGKLYGVTASGGAENLGTVFRVGLHGGLKTLASFTSATGHGAESGLVLGADGNFYGSNPYGGPTDNGTVIRVTPAGQVTAIASFTGDNGTTPFGRLVQMPGGSFFGVTAAGGANGLGVVFKVTKAGALTVLHHFDASEGLAPQAGLSIGDDGRLFGTTYQGGSDGYGTIFRINPSSGAFATLVNFDYATRGGFPKCELLLGPDGAFYGVAAAGPSNQGMVFRVTKAGGFSTLATFDGSDGAQPEGGLAYGNDGNFYGVTTVGGSSGLGTAFRLTTSGTLTSLVSFDAPEGISPLGPLLPDGDGGFYGTTSGGGSGNYGAVYHRAADGVFSILHSFTNTDGAYPGGALARGLDGNIYGTTTGGGATLRGTVFKVSPSGVLISLYSFPGGDGGAQPSGLMRAADGNFYGVTTRGGPHDFGTIFRMTPAGGVTILKVLEPFDGVLPRDTMIQGPGDLLFGTTPQGGGAGFGTVYKLSTTTGAFSVIHALTSQEGHYLFGPVLLHSDGALYGTTAYGGDRDSGVVFRMTLDGAYSIVHSFGSDSPLAPFAGLIEGSDGTMYGTILNVNGDPLYESGAVFRVTPFGDYDLLAQLPDAVGAYPEFELAPGSDGKFYSVTERGGRGDFGGIFAVNRPPSAPRGLTASARREGITLAWNAVSGAASYNVYQGNTPGGEGPSPVANVSNTTLVLSSLAGGEYFFRVTALTSHGESVRSSEVAVVVDDVPDAVIFPSKADVQRSTFQKSDKVVVTGFDVPLPISVSGGMYSIGTGAFTNAAGMIRRGQGLRLRHRSSNRFDTTVTTTVTIGATQATFSSTTEHTGVE